MDVIRREEILPLAEYEQVRTHFRARVIEGKRARRVAVGPFMTAVFENRDSVLLQIQEMLRTERITAEAGIAHEIETYNDLIPGEGELSLTLFVEIAEREEREKQLARLAGLHEKVFIEVDGERYAAKGDREGAAEDRTTAVHYFKAQLPAPALERIREKKAEVAVVVDHAGYAHRQALTAGGLSALAADLAG